MKKIGITGSLASGKTTASKILSSKRGPLFSADLIVKKLYSDQKFKNLLIKKFKFKNKSNLKKNLRKIILENKLNIFRLEKIVHPIVREKMKKFIFKNRKKKLIFLEIPLLIESNLVNTFDTIIFIKTNRNLRLKRFRARGGNLFLFNLLNDRQFSDNKKVKFSDHVVVNEKNKKFLKKKLLDIISLYE